MNQRGWQRLGASAGIAFPVLTFVGLSIADDPRGSRFLGVYVFLLGVFVLFWFVAFIYGLLREAEGQRGWLSSVALGGGIVWAGLWLTVAAIVIAYEAPTGPAAAETFDAIMWRVGGVFGPAVASFVGATSLVALRYGILPRWLCWVGLVLAAVQVLSGFLGGFLVLVARVWALLVAVVLLRRAWAPSA